ncbi:MAG: sigma-54-dependent Fis family transcriptional regulator [Acidobacteria bacterium]|nr:sigma-54-dependent Fis family transcriptional regulator [Acidobacteriota bacterium]
MIRLLITDDDKNLRSVLATELASEGFDTREAPAGQTALEMLRHDDFDVLLLDLTMPGLSGMEVLQTLKKEEITTEVVLLTANATVPTAVEAMKLGAYDFLIKPVKIQELVAVIRRAAEKHGLVRENRLLRSQIQRQMEFPEIVTDSPKIRQVLDNVRRVAPSDVAVHISGETGVGKELVARAVHSASPRAAKSFIAVNCSAFTESMFESEFFGHEKGAFTGAAAQKPGLFELAHEGTFFIDEIGEMPLTTQAKLLRVLETGTYFRVGGTRELRSDVRIVSASNKNLTAECERGMFREDLYWRIGAINLHIPPLRERREDIVALTRHFMVTHPVARGKKISRAAMDLLAEYDWPGNVRELLNVLQRAVLLHQSDELQPQDFHGVERTGHNRDLRSLKDVEREHIRHILAQTGGHRGQTAEILGIDAKTLYRKMNSYGIDD